MPDITVEMATALDVVIVAVPSAQTVEATMGGTKGDPGASAYDVAVAHGFAGSEADWLASLVGGAAGQEQIDAAVQAHVTDPLPHPVYDDMPSLALIYLSRTT